MTKLETIFLMLIGCLFILCSLIITNQEKEIKSLKNLHNSWYKEQIEKWVAPGWQAQKPLKDHIHIYRNRSLKRKGARG